jgi:hypothetical protein
MKNLFFIIKKVKWRKVQSAILKFPNLLRQFAVKGRSAPLMWREAVEYIGAIVNPVDDYKLVESLIKNQNVIRGYCYFVFC